MDPVHDASTEGDAAAALALRRQLDDARRELQARDARMARMRSALQALPDGVVVVDAEGRITEMNLGAAHLTGWTEAQSLGRPLHQVVQLLDSQGRPLDLLAADAIDTDATALVRHDAHQVLVAACLTPLFPESGAPGAHPAGSRSAGARAARSAGEDSTRSDGSAAPASGDSQPPVHEGNGSGATASFIPRAIGSVLTFRNVTAARRINDELTYHATHDALTGALNRRALETRLKRAVTNAQEHGTPHALLYLDLDRFKAVNDQGGHFAGDELLRALTALLQRSLREHDTLARLGGDEFAMLLAHCTASKARTVATRMRAAIAEYRFPWQGQVFDVGASIGLVTFRNGALSPRSLLLRADEMCYLAKAKGRNQVQAIDAERPAARAPSRRRPAEAR